jgi:penicillin-binding protein 1C
MQIHPFFRYTGLLLVLGGGLLAYASWRNLAPLPATVSFLAQKVQKQQILDRQQQPLTITYQNQWNIHDVLPLYAMPQDLVQWFILAEDQHFYQHHGVDWRARLAALVQNVRAGRVVRGASTLTEQVVRLLYPRPRSLWARWLEGWDAYRLERKFSKAAILEFYLNQVPYAQQRRGVVQAARLYFDRSLDTLNLAEKLALAVMVRSPSRLDLHLHPQAIQKPLQQLAKRLLENQYISQDDFLQTQQQPLQLRHSVLNSHASQFVQYIYGHQTPQNQQRIHTTLDSELQQYTYDLLQQRLHQLAAYNVHQAAALVVDLQNQHILAWVNASQNQEKLPEETWIDAVTLPRQPGSTLKPFIYALALAKGWTAATLIDDSPLTEAIGFGLHSYHNYSHQYYGPLRLRDALGNSLNTPAVRAMQFVGVDTALRTLRQLGMNLEQGIDFYGDGLALGNGEVSLFELVQAYTALAHQGQFRPLTAWVDHDRPASRPVFSPEVSSLVANILSDPDARHLEFGRSSLLRFPVQTAVKTGTSTDYHDAWAVGFNYRYAVGVWLGNVDQSAMQEISGAIGAVLVLRSLFAKLNQNQTTEPLFLSPKLHLAAVCRDTGLLANEQCASRSEWFLQDTLPAKQAPTAGQTPKPLRLQQPSYDLQLASDPRIPDEYEAFALQINRDTVGTVQWFIDGQWVAQTEGQNYYLWPLQRGKHYAQAKILEKIYTVNMTQTLLETAVVPFMVK